MEANTVPPAPSKPPVLSIPTPAQSPAAQTAPTPPAVPAHTAQAAPPAMKPVPASPAPSVTAPKTAPPAAPATAPAVVDSVQGVGGDVTVDNNAPTSTPIDTGAEAKLTAEITNLWAEQKDGRASARRTRAELKSLRLALAEKLHIMKAILVRTGRGSGWASYLRAQHLPLSSADRYVAAHEATLAAPEEKLLTKQLPEVTVDEVRKLAKKMLPKLCRVLTTPELAFEFLGELFWNIPDAEGRETDDGLEVFRTSHDADTSVEDQAAEVAIPAPPVP